MTTSSSAGSWWPSFFDATYAAIGLETRSDEARAKRESTVSLIVDRLGLRAGDTIFDQCCGIGRMSLPLAQRGLCVIGVDQAPGYIDLARGRADAAGLACEFQVADAFDFVTPRPCDGAINWFTSFGYDRDDDVNVRMLVRAHESLRDGGRLALDYISVPRVLAEFRTCQLERFPQGDGELLLITEPTIDFAAGMLGGAWTFVRPDGSRESRRMENRAYMPHDLVRLFRAAGFVDIEVIGPDGKPFDRASRRCIVVGRKL